MPKKFESRSTGGTVIEAQAKTFVELVESGVPKEEAAAQAGITLAQLRAQGQLSFAVRRLLKTLNDSDLLVEENQKKLARARLTELMMQDEDMGAAIRAAKALLGTDQTNVNVINQVSAGAPPSDPAILSALMSLGLNPQPTTDDEGDTNVIHGKE